MMDVLMTQKQGQVLSTQMIQSVEILQMSTQELLEYLQSAILENPVLELEEHHDIPDESADLRRRLEWLESADPQNRDYHRQDSEADWDFLRKCGEIDSQSESLYDHILAQLKALELSADMVVCTSSIAESLDENGWFDESIPDLAQELGQPEDTVMRALAVVQSLDPPGTAARNLSECLCLQLKRRMPENALAILIAGDHLEALSRNHYGLIAQRLGAELEAVRQACDLIRSLDPRPGSQFAAQSGPAYIIPDVIVARTADGFELSMNDHTFPMLNISGYYRRLLKESDDAQVKDYLTQKVGQAKWMVQAVEQRRKTLLSCVECIVELQADFFFQNGHLNPLSLADVAERVGIHQSTVSRAVNGKYLQCTRGIYPLNHFFSRRAGVTSGMSEVSIDSAKALLKKLIEEEDKRKPLSDQKLCERMKAHGCVLARRTVAKYRDELGIPGTAGRKQFL